MTDFSLVSYGTVALLQPLTPSAAAWTDAHLPDSMHWGDAVAIEHRFVHDIATGIAQYGFTIEGEEA